MNLFELQERLKDFSQDQLVREMQAPTGMAPQYLVLSELQRRQRMMAQEQAQMPTPQTTVAEDAIAAAGVPQGGLADMARAMAPKTDMDMNTAVRPVERMQEGGSVDDRESGFIRRLLNNVRERARNSRMTDDELAYLLGRRSYNVPEFMSPVAALRDAADLYEEGDYPGAVLNAASALPAGRIVGPALNAYAEVYNRSGDDDVEGMAGGGVVRMQPGGLARISRDLGAYYPTMGGGGSRSPMMEERNARRRRAEIAAAAEPLLRFNRDGTPNVEGFAADLAALGIIPDEEMLSGDGPDPGFYPTRGILEGMEEGEGPYTEALRSDIERQRRRLTPDDYQSLGETGPLDPRSPSYVPPFDTSGAYSALLGAPSSAEAMLGDIGPLQGPMQREPYSPTRQAAPLSARPDILMDLVPETGVTPFPLLTDPDLPSGYRLNRVLFPGEDPEETLRRLQEAQRNRKDDGATATDEFSGLPTDMAPEGSGDVSPAGALPPITQAEMDEIDSMREARRILTSDAAYTLPDKAKDTDTDTDTDTGSSVPTSPMDDAFEQDKWLALAQAGLALMSSRQPTLGGAIGEAGLAGITALRQARGERDERIAARQARADRLAAAGRERAPGYEDKAVGDLLTMRQRLFEEARSYFDSELGEIRPGYEERYNDLMKNIDAIDVMVSSATMSRFPGLMEALTGE